MYSSCPETVRRRPCSVMWLGCVIRGPIAMVSYHISLQRCIYEIAEFIYTSFWAYLCINIINIQYYRIDRDNTFHLIVHLLHYSILQFDCVWGDRSGWGGGSWARLSCLCHRYFLTSSSPRRSTLSPYRYIQVKISMSGRSKQLDSNAKECQKRTLHDPSGGG